MPDEIQKSERKKRTTVADLEKDLYDLRTATVAGLMEWCGELDTRLDKLDGDTPGNMPTIVADLNARLETLEAGPLSDRADVAADINARLDMLESTIGSGELQLRLGAEQRIEVLGEVTRDLADTMGKAAEWMKFCNNRFDEAEGSIRSLQTAAVDLQETLPEPELEFAKPPEQPASWQANISDIMTVASVCLTMNDVLTVCRALKESPDSSDQDKIQILNIACRAAGVPDTQGLRIRAGISSTQA